MDGIEIFKKSDSSGTSDYSKSETATPPKDEQAVNQNESERNEVISKDDADKTCERLNIDLAKKYYSSKDECDVLRRECVRLRSENDTFRQRIIDLQKIVESYELVISRGKFKEHEVREEPEKEQPMSFTQKIKKRFS